MKPLLRFAFRFHLFMLLIFIVIIIRYCWILYNNWWVCFRRLCRLLHSLSHGGFKTVNGDSGLQLAEITILWLAGLNIDWGYLRCNAFFVHLSGGNVHRFPQVTDNPPAQHYRQTNAYRKGCTRGPWKNLQHMCFVRQVVPCFHSLITKQTRLIHDWLTTTPRLGTGQGRLLC